MLIKIERFIIEAKHTIVHGSKTPECALPNVDGMIYPRGNGPESPQVPDPYSLISDGCRAAKLSMPDSSDQSDGVSNWFAAKGIKP
jgi:hypothetical protein